MILVIPSEGAAPNGREKPIVPLMRIASVIVHRCREVEILPSVLMLRQRRCRNRGRNFGAATTTTWAADHIALDRGNDSRSLLSNAAKRYLFSSKLR